LMTQGCLTTNERVIEVSAATPEGVEVTQVKNFVSGLINEHVLIMVIHPPARKH
jgi:hypothetical protein